VTKKKPTQAELEKILEDMDIGEYKHLPEYDMTIKKGKKPQVGFGIPIEKQPSKSKVIVSPELKKQKPKYRKYRSKIIPWFLEKQKWEYK